MSYNEVYKITDDNTSSLFIAPYDTIIPNIYKGELDLFEINDYLPEIPVDVVQPYLVDQYLNNPKFKFSLALEENNLIDWKTDVLHNFVIVLDTKSLKENSITAFNVMKENGSKQLYLRKVGNKLITLPVQDMLLFTPNSGLMVTKRLYYGRKGHLLKRLALSLKKAIS